MNFSLSLNRAKVLGPDGSSYSGALDGHAGSDADDMWICDQSIFLKILFSNYI